MMLSVHERKLLKIIKERQLVTKGELKMLLNGEGSDMSAISLERLKEKGYIDMVESFSNCIVVTQKGIRILGE